MKYKTLFVSITAVIFLFTVAFPQNETAESVEKAQAIVAKYLNAVGGTDALKNIVDKTVIMRGTAMDQTVTLILKQKRPNKLRQEVKAGGMDQILIYDGEKAVMKVAGQTINIEGKQLEQLKLESEIEFLLNPESAGIKLSYEGTEQAGDNLLHKVKFILPSGLNWVAYFDDKTGLKIKEIKETDTEMGLITQIVEYSDYQDVDGIKIPFKMVQSFGPQSIDLTISSVKINKGIPDDIFVISE